jgi:hypothetical protein
MTILAKKILKKKKQKVTHYNAEILVETQDRHGEYVPIRALLEVPEDLLTVCGQLNFSA